MAATRNTGSILVDEEGNNRTATHLSTNIIIIVEGKPIGAIQTISVDENRPNIAMIDEVGTDGHIDSAPSASTDYSIECSRIRFARMRIAEAFGRGFVHVHSQRVPFDIEIHDRFHDADEANSIVTTIQNCWIKKIAYTFDAKNFVITDSMSLVAEGISSVFSTSNNVVSQVNALGQPIYVNSFERAADRGQYRGSLDAPGLINAFLSDPA